MRSKLHDVRKLIQESLFRGDGYRVAHGIVWVSLVDHPDLAVPGARVLFDPDEEWHKNKETGIKHLKLNIGRLMKTKRGSADQRQRLVDELEKEKKRQTLVGKIGILVRVYGPDVLSVKFDNEELQSTFYTKHFWVATDQDPDVDYRPNDSLPEDFYAL